jgi:hypothetical protein
MAKSMPELQLSLQAAILSLANVLCCAAGGLRTVCSTCITGTAGTAAPHAALVDETTLAAADLTVQNILA